MNNKAFTRAVEKILEKYQTTQLPNRWHDAVAFGAGEAAKAFWIRDSEDVVNIVWLNSDGIRDITYLPSLNESVFNFVKVKNIVTFETREGVTVSEFGPHVEGEFAVLGILASERGQLYWVAHTAKEERDLRAFVSEVLDSHVSNH